MSSPASSFFGSGVSSVISSTSTSSSSASFFLGGGGGGGVGFEPNGFAVLDVENLRRHYALTARHWLSRYEANARRIEELVGRETARAWRLYLAGTVAAFEAASLHLYQIVFTRAENDAIPWTRADWYPGGLGS